jgi:hypothetical protein
MSELNDKHLDIYMNRYEFYQNGEPVIFRQGPQNKESQSRYKLINDRLGAGFLEDQYARMLASDLLDFAESHKTLLKQLVDGVTSEVGRALVGLTVLQLSIKAIAPNQNIRLHKGTTRKGSFSWVDGISMRTIDSSYNTPFLRAYGLLQVNKYGVFMTRSLAENYPYTDLYKAEMRGPFKEWIEIVNAVESTSLDAESALIYLLSLLQNRSDKFKTLVDEACKLILDYEQKSFNVIKSIIVNFFNNTKYSARAFEVVIHGFYQALEELDLLEEADIVPLSQMRSANKKHGNIGDIELNIGDSIIESWDAKYGKPYLRDELDELREKLIFHPECQVAGFITDSFVDRRTDILERIDEIKNETNTDIYIFSFEEWLSFKTSDWKTTDFDQFGYYWIKCIVESFSQKRPDIAPIDEPCDAWVRDLIALLKNEK